MEGPVLILTTPQSDGVFWSPEEADAWSLLEKSTEV